MPEATSTTNTTKSPDKKVNFSETVEEDEASDPPKDPLYKSSRLKGYITLILASVINFSAARNSDVGKTHAPSEGQQAYAESVALVSCLTSIFVFCAHLDRFTCLRNVWEKAFGDGSVIELLVILFLVIWWTVATAIETTVRGIAGDGREQFNLYYSTWCCCWTSYWTLERWLVAYGWASFKAFISSWPFRAPGWIAILILSFLTLMWYLDLYSNHFQATLDAPILAQHYAEVSDAQWQWLLFVGSSTLVPSVVFIVVELFRTTSPSDTSTGNVDANNNHNNHNNTTPDIKRQRFSMAIASPQQRPSMLAATMAGSIMTGSGRTSRQLIPQRQNPLPDKGNSAGGKGPLENILEGFCLMLLLMAWIPTVIVATTPGGAASLVGNAYFFTWATTVFVVETSIWFIHDLRKGVHSALQVKEREYQKFQTEVLQKSRALEAKRMAAGSWQNEALDDIELDDIPATARMTAPVIATTKPHPHHHHNATNVTTTDLSASQEEEGDAEPTPKNRNTSSNNNAIARNLSQDATQRVHNVRARTRAVDLHDEPPDGAVPMPPDDPTGSTLFFETMDDDNNEKNDGTDNVEDLF